jgi:hypothetical protein
MRSSDGHSGLYFDEASKRHTATSNAFAGTGTGAKANPGIATAIGRQVRRPRAAPVCAESPRATRMLT